MIKPGTLLQNRYRVSEQIGKGGMGEVYLATDERFQSVVAIKRTFYDDPEMCKAFKREARLLNHLRHAALPKVSDHFSEEGGQFLVMEYIEGSDLAELLMKRKVPFPLSDVLQWADELLDALDYLHTHEPPIVHRDIKPPNIKLTPRGKVVLLDFGLAKGAPSQTASAVASSVFGYSLNFAPLEQMQGSGTDPRSDLYSLAATLYSLFTGVRPPDAVTRASAAIKEQPDPLRPAHLIQPQVPAAIGQVLHRAMSLNPALRHSSAAELRASLRQASKDAVSPAARPLGVSANALGEGHASDQAGLPDEGRVHSSAPSRSILQARPKPATLSGTVNSFSSSGTEATVVDARRVTRPVDSFTRVAHAPESSSTKRNLGIVACLVIACVAAGAYFLTRASNSPAGASVNAEAQNPGAEYQQVVSEGQTPPATVPDSSRTAPDTSAPVQQEPSRPAFDTSVSNPQSTTSAATAPAADAKGAGAVSDGSNGTVAETSSAGRPGLEIRNPTPAATPTPQPRRIEEPRREPEYRPEYSNGPPPQGPYPPPPGDRRLPPPDGRRPPPPFGRP